MKEEIIYKEELEMYNQEVPKIKPNLILKFKRIFYMK